MSQSMGIKRIKLAVTGHRGFPGVQGGVEKHCEALMPILADNMDITIYRRKAYLHPESHTDLPNIRYVDLPSTKIKGFEALFHTFISCVHILFHRPDIVNVHNIGPGLFIPILRLFRLKVVLTYHSANYEHAKWDRLAKVLLRICEYISLRSADRIIFVNKFQMHKYGEDIRRKSIYIPNGIPIATKSDRHDFLDRYHLEPHNFILAVGRLTPEKGFDILIQAVNQCSSAIPLVIAGASDHDPQYIEYLKKLDVHKRVTFTGFTSGEELRQLYSNAVFFVLSSINEGFPLVMLEAMSYGLPMIVTDIPASRLVKLRPDCYVKPNDVTALQTRIDRMLTATENQTAEYDLNSFHWPEIASQTYDVYHELFYDHA